MSKPDLPELDIACADELWDWLAKNHAAGSVLMVTWKASSPDKYVSREEVLDAVVAHGWIDGRRWKHSDPRRTIQLIGPRGQKVWAATYKRRAERLIEEGRMHPAGRANYDAARASDHWSESDPIDALVVPADLRAALDKQEATEWFDAAAPSYRRNVLRFLAGARREATRAKRVALIAEHSARGEKVPQY